MLTSTQNARDHVALFGNRILLLGIGISGLAAVALGLQFVESRLAIAAALALCSVAAATHLCGGPARPVRYVLAVVLMAFVALHIQLARGTNEMHFGVFVALALLLVYRDWTVVVCGAVAIAVHHVAFDRLQAAGFGVYCTTQADFLRVTVHAVYVVIQTGVEVVLALGLQRLAAAGDELQELVSRIDREEGLALDAIDLPLHTPAAHALQRALSRMRDAVREVRDGAQAVEAASSEISAGNDDLSRRTEAQASALQETSASVSQLAGTMAANAEHAAQADALAKEAAETAGVGGQTMVQVVEQMGGIGEGSRRIAEITSVIDGIAFQTNILALNAAVEAARAGEQGRGFAVVASEVRSLAQRSARAAREIKDLLERSSQQVDEGGKLVNAAGTTMQAIVTDIQRVSEAMSGISAAGSQQRAGFDQLGSAVSQIDQATQQNAALVEQSTAAATSLRQQAQRLVEAVSVFKL